jgi:polyhydroxyalkanoate synthesis regulator phasin
MTGKLTQRLDDIAEYLRQLEQDHLDELADRDDEIAELRARLDALESQITNLES